MHDSISWIQKIFFKEAVIYQPGKTHWNLPPPPAPKSEICEMSFVNRSIKLWNSLPDSCVTAYTVPRSETELVNTSFYRDVNCQP